MITTRVKAAIGGAVAGLALLALTAGPVFAQPPSPTPSPAASATSRTPITGAQMEQMMAAVNGAGSFQRMEQAMGPNADKLIDQCMTMMNTMSSMSSMMNGTSRMSGMMNSQNGQSTPNGGER